MLWESDRSGIFHYASSNEAQTTCHISKCFQIWAIDHIFIIHPECHWSRVCVLVVRCASSKREESEEIIEEYRERKVCAPPEHLEHLEEAY